MSLILHHRVSSAPGAGYGPARPSACRSQTIKIRQGLPASAEDPQHQHTLVWCTCKYTQWSQQDGGSTVDFWASGDSERGEGAGREGTYIGKQPPSMHKASCTCPALSSTQTRLPRAWLAPPGHQQRPGMLGHRLQPSHLQKLPPAPSFPSSPAFYHPDPAHLPATGLKYRHLLAQGTRATGPGKRRGAQPWGKLGGF